MKLIQIFFALSIALTIVPKASANLILEVNSNGQITEIQNFAIGQELFNIQFVDGACNMLAVFNGCDDNGDFGVFSEPGGPSALTFAQAFATFLESLTPGSTFVTTAPLTFEPIVNFLSVNVGSVASFFGCEIGGCFIQFPSSVFSENGSDFSVEGATAGNISFFPVFSTIPSVEEFSLPTSFSIASNPALVFAFVTRADDSTAVPEPSPLILLALGLFSIAIRRKRVL